MADFIASTRGGARAGAQAKRGSQADSTYLRLDVGPLSQLLGRTEAQQQVEAGIIAAALLRGCTAQASEGPTSLAFAQNAGPRARAAAPFR